MKLFTHSEVQHFISKESSKAKARWCRRYPEAIKFEGPIVAQNHPRSQKDCWRNFTSTERMVSESCSAFKKYIPVDISLSGVFDVMKSAASIFLQLVVY
jgi:hypothetical protein